MTTRSLRPLPFGIRSTPLADSMSATRRCETSLIRSPPPYASMMNALLRSLIVTARQRRTSPVVMMIGSLLRTRGVRRPCTTSGRRTVTLNTNRIAAA